MAIQSFGSRVGRIHLEAATWLFTGRKELCLLNANNANNADNASNAGSVTNKSTLVRGVFISRLFNWIKR
jgi:hypothetical protein